MRRRTADAIEESKARKRSEKAPKASGRGSHPNSRKNLVAPWPKGYCPNPGGKPKKDWSAEIARLVFEGNVEAIYTAMSKALLRGNAYTFKELADRAYGKVKEKIEHSGPDGGAMRFEGASPKEVHARIAELLPEYLKRQQQEKDQQEKKKT
jgi:hypothetical protein